MKTIFLAGVLFIISSLKVAGEYNPLAISYAFTPSTLDLAVKDARRDRSVPVLIYLPDATNAASVVMFSHGLGGSRKGCAYLGKHWAARGYVAVFVQHPGSDDSVWKNAAGSERMKAMEKAAGGKNYLLRVKDVPVVLDQLEKWNIEQGHALKGRMDLEHIGMSGHSFGAVTTQAVSGQTVGRGRITFTDPRIKAAIAFSPSTPQRGKAEDAFHVRIPWMLMTGTKDISIIGNADMASRLAVYPALPPGGKFELVLHNAEHSAFSDRALPGDTESRNPNHHRAILALSTAFWDCYLREDKAALEWLNGEGPRSILERPDRWQHK